MSSHDKDIIGRRSRLKSTSTGKRIRLQARDLLWFEKLHEHGPLPSSFLLQYSKATHQNDKRSLERLGDLFHEDNTPDQAPYLTRPRQQFRTIDSRYNQLVYDLAPAAHRALRRAGRYNTYRSHAAGPWLHSHMIACITASIELATLDDPSLTYLPQSLLLERAGAELRYPTEIRDPRSGSTRTIDLIPDALFGLKYDTPNGPRYRCFLVEAVRATEPLETASWNRKSWLRNLAQYETYLCTGAYREHLNLKAPLVVLAVTTSQERMRRMEKAASQYSSKLQQRVWLRCWEAFGGVWRPGKPQFSMLSKR